MYLMATATREDYLRCHPQPAAWQLVVMGKLRDAGFRLHYPIEWWDDPASFNREYRQEIPGSRGLDWPSVVALYQFLEARGEQ